MSMNRRGDYYGVDPIILSRSETPLLPTRIKPLTRRKFSRVQVADGKNLRSFRIGKIPYKVRPPITETHDANADQSIQHANTQIANMPKFLFPNPSRIIEG